MNPASERDCRLKKEYIELKRIVFNKEIIIQKLSSSKNIKNKIPKNNKTDCSTINGEGNSICKKVTKCQNPPKENVAHHGQDSSQIQ